MDISIKETSTQRYINIIKLKIKETINIKKQTENCVNNKKYIDNFSQLYANILK